PFLASWRTLSCQATRRWNWAAIPSQKVLASSNGTPACLESVLGPPPYDQPCPSGLAICRYLAVVGSCLSVPTTSLPHAAHALMRCPSAPGSERSAYASSADNQATTRASALL